MSAQLEPEAEPSSYELQRELDRTKSSIFSGKGANFFGPLMCSLEFSWRNDIKTAATDGVHLYWNPKFFLSLDPATRTTVLIHELMHPAYLHFVRRGDRNPRLWNQATDYFINNNLKAQGYSFKGIEWGCLDPSIPLDMPEEDIYDLLIQRGEQVPAQPGDMLEPSKGDLSKGVSVVIQATHQAKASGGAGDIPGTTETILRKFLAPVVPWETLLHRFMQDLLEQAYSWRRPNRRFSSMYLPSSFEDDGRLDHLIYFEDVSGSISNQDVIRFNSEIKYVWDTYKPQKLTVVQFDTRIQQVIEFKDEDTFDEIKVIGRGGTSLECVADYIEEHQPTAAIVFSDLCCSPMRRPKFEIPIIWVCISNRSAKVPFGEIIHIR